MEILGIPPGREVGEAYRFLLELRLDDGPMTEEHAEQALRAWWYHPHALTFAMKDAHVA